MKWLIAFICLLSTLLFTTPAFAQRTCNRNEDCPSQICTFQRDANGQFVGMCEPSQDPNPTCISQDGRSLGIRTAIGCLWVGEPKVAIEQILGWAISVGGGVAFLLIVYAGFQISTAQGDPKKMQAARDLLTSAISGLILIVFSVAILNVVGVSILHLDLFGFTI